MTKPREKPILNVVQMPPMCSDVAAMLRLLADQVDAGEFGDDVSVVNVVCGDKVQVRGYGRMAGLEAVGVLHLGAAQIIDAVNAECGE